jgi:anti-anti-sigma regulatory factor
MGKATFHKVSHPDPRTAVFQIKGRVGYRENESLQKLVNECRKRDLERIIFDLSELESLGGRGARMLRDLAEELGRSENPVAFVVTSPHVKKFLQPGGADPVGLLFESLPEALGDGEGKAKASGGESRSAEGSPEFVRRIDEAIDRENGEKEKPGKRAAGAGPSPDDSDPALERPAPAETEASGEETGGTGGDPIPLGAVGEPTSAKESASEGSGAKTSREKKESPRSSGDSPEPTKGSPVGGVFHDRRSRARPSMRPEGAGLTEDSGKVMEELFEGEAPEDVAAGAAAGSDGELIPGGSKELKRQILALRNLLSLSSDFNSLREKDQLLDLFLLSSISQGGVQCSAFFRVDGRDFRAGASKGCDLEEIRRITIEGQWKGVSRSAASMKVAVLKDLGLEEETIHALHNAGFRYGLPFRVKGHLLGLVFLGEFISQSMDREMRGSLISILCNQAAIAYENALLFEEQHERTLGVVKTLVSLIEKNTLTAGTAEQVSRYVGMLAREMSYPDEYFRDLIYGTVLRDIGMVKVSDLIVRSPRELNEREWEIIKQHPRDGAEMLRRMKFSEHTCEVVLCHHERFNGEGYPAGLRGRAIPLGARIVSAVESFIAMLHERPNRPALKPAEAIESMAENWGNRYDPQVVEPLVGLVRKDLEENEDILEVAHDMEAL